MIIAEQGQKVNSSWGKYKRMSMRVLKHFRTAAIAAPGLRRRYERMKECGNTVEYTVENGIFHYKKAWLCRDRLCPVCSWRLAIKRIGEMMKTLQLLNEREPDTKAIHVVLTVRNCPAEELGSVLKQLTSGFTRLKKRQLWKDYILGYARSVEITYNAESDSYHPHIHTVCIVRESYTKQISIGDWSDMWRDSARINYNPIVFAKQAYSKVDPADYIDIEDDLQHQEVSKSAAQAAIIEATKYAMKSEEIVAAAEAGDLDIIASAIAGVRMISYGGIIKQLRKELLYTTDDEQLPECTINPAEALDKYTVVYQWCAASRSYITVENSTNVREIS